ncbi:hypothetical protein PR048_010097 [Dryococelus australis]|uniref:THAP9-like helix-turn-helix domain-containing protein n=1 Tax=Dryococelus australis TaxID=614101 RepID=A0ABQ9I3N9_9NEOP|nr:hypothetical protein PR048_010097 [Dryococelus australis]
MGERRRRWLKPEAFPSKNLPNRKETVDCARSERLQCRSIKRKLVDDDNETVSQENYQISEMERITTNTEAAPPPSFKPDLNFQKEIYLLKLRIITLDKQLTKAKRSSEVTVTCCEINSQTIKRKVWWEDGYIAAAITLRSISPNAYSYLRKKIYILLPGLSTLRKWTRNVKCAPGVLEEVFTALHAKSQTITLSERLTVLSLD